MPFDVRRAASIASCWMSPIVCWRAVILLSAANAWCDAFTIAPNVGTISRNLEKCGERTTSTLTASPAEAAVKAYGNDFLHDFEPAGTNKNGGFITSCICHGCPWDKLTFEGNKTAYEYYADWANSRDFPRQPKSLVVDSRGPNGDGDLTFSECSPFPSP